MIDVLIFRYVGLREGMLVADFVCILIVCSYQSVASSSSTKPKFDQLEVIEITSQLGLEYYSSSEYKTKFLVNELDDHIRIFRSRCSLDIKQLCLI